MKPELDINAPFAIQVIQMPDEDGKPGHFGIICDDRDGQIIARQSAREFVLERKLTIQEYSARGGSWPTSAVLWSIFMDFNIITVNNHQHLVDLAGPPPHTRYNFGNVAGRACYIKIDRAPFEELLKSSININSGNTRYNSVEEPQDSTIINNEDGSVTITRNNMTVTCYGEWEETSNCVICGEFESGDDMEDIWAGDGWDKEQGPANWVEVVEHLTAWAQREGHTIEELSAC